jgi:hypothetical protein
MKVHLYTINEIIEGFRTLSREQDSITALMASGHFRAKFEGIVSDSRTQREEAGVATLPERLVSFTHDGESVYLLDDIQNMLTKGQFSSFMQFLRDRHIPINMDETTYIPTSLVDQFIQSETPDAPVEDEPFDDVATTKSSTDIEDDLSPALKFA